MKWRPWRDATVRCGASRGTGQKNWPKLKWVEMLSRRDAQWLVWRVPWRSSEIMHLEVGTLWYHMSVCHIIDWSMISYSDITSYLMYLISYTVSFVYDIKCQRYDIIVPNYDIIYTNLCVSTYDKIYIWCRIQYHIYDIILLYYDIKVQHMLS